MADMTAIGLLVLGAAGLGSTLWWRWRRQTRLAGQALLQATEAGDLAVMQALLARHADLKSRNAQGWTPLHVAAAGGDREVVALLLRHGAEVNARCNVGATPLDQATARGGRQAVVELLRAHGAQANPSWESSL